MEADWQSHQAGTASAHACFHVTITGVNCAMGSYQPVNKTLFRHLNTLWSLIHYYMSSHILMSQTTPIFLSCLFTFTGAAVDQMVEA